MTQTESLKSKSAIKIEKNIPLPKYTKLPSEARNNLAEDLKKMKPLESRLIDVEHTEKSLNATRTRIYTILDKENIKGKFTINVDPITYSRHEKDKDVKVLLRVWRIL